MKKAIVILLCILIICLMATPVAAAADSTAQPAANQSDLFWVQVLLVAIDALLAGAGVAILLIKKYS